MMKYVWKQFGVFREFSVTWINHMIIKQRPLVIFHWILNPKTLILEINIFIHTILHNVANFTHNLFLFICLTLTFMNKLHVHHLFEFYESMVFLEVVKVIKD